MASQDSGRDARVGHPQCLINGGGKVGVGAVGAHAKSGLILLKYSCKSLFFEVAYSGL